jgi:IclR family transcriptional regulator, KDG regulon repressor
MDKTLVKGLQVLEFMARADRTVRISDVAQALDLTRSNAYRALKTLESAGFLRQDPVNKDFAAGVKIWELGLQVGNQFDVKARAAEALRDLAERSHETVHLAVLDGGEVVYVDKIDSSEPVASYTRLGGRAPAYCVATGKALLSTLTDAELTARIGEMQRHSAFTITDMDALRAELEATRKRGYATNRGEWRESVWGIAAVIRDNQGTAIAAVGVSGPSYRLSDDARFTGLSVMVLEAADRITRKYYSPE